MDVAPQSALQTKPFLWGPVKSALIQDAKKHGPDTILKLCYEDHQRVREMMVAVLTDLGRDDADIVKGILDKLLPGAKEPGAPGRVWQLLHKRPSELPRSQFNAATIAVEVAGALGAKEMLQRAALHGDAGVRAVATRHTYLFWEHESEGGFEVLDYTARNVMHGALPDLSAFESLLGLSLTIFFSNAQNTAALRRLQTTWQGTFDKVLGLRGKGGQIGSAVRGFIRERVFSAAINRAFSILEEMPPGWTLISYPDIKAFFRLDAETKALFARYTQYIDNTASFDIEVIRRDLLAGVRVKNGLFALILVNALEVQMSQDPVPWVAFLRELLDGAVSDPQPNHMPYLLPGVASTFMERGHYEPEMVKFFLDAVDILQPYYHERPTIPGMDADYVYAPAAAYLDIYILTRYRMYGNIVSPWLMDRTAGSFARRDRRFMESMLKQALPYVALPCAELEAHSARAALDGLMLLLEQFRASGIADSRDEPDRQFSREFDELVELFLSRLRVHYPNEVDDFLQEQQFSDTRRLKIVTGEPTETIGELIGARSWLFVIDGILFGSQPLRTLYSQVLAQASVCTNERTWLNNMIREIVNVVYGGQALRTEV